jgi:hypothetical protein
VSRAGREFRLPVAQSRAYRRPVGIYLTMVRRVRRAMVAAGVGLAPAR